MPFLLASLPIRFLAADILQRFTVRIHSRIVEKGRAWARLWYLLRGLDSQGSGYVCLPAALPIGLLASSSSTLRQWLREGKEAGAFRKWKVRRGILRVALGGLFAVCQRLGLTPDSKRRKGIAPWGVTSQIPLHQVQSLQTLRAAATASTAQRLQQLSRFSAWRNLPAQLRKTIRLPQPDDFFQDGIQQQKQFSDDSASGNLPRCCIHIGKKRAWVSKGFIPFGASQNAIAKERGICDRSVRRHLNLAEVDRRQIVQSKGEYQMIASAIQNDAGGVRGDYTNLWSDKNDDYWLNERTGENCYTHKVGTVGFSAIHSRFFLYGKKPKAWLYRCNIYRPSIHLRTMSAARGRYRLEMLMREAKEIWLEKFRPDVLHKIEEAGGVTRCNLIGNSTENLDPEMPYQAEKDGQNP